MRLLLLLTLSEFVRSGFFVGFLAIQANSFGLSATTVGLLLTAHYLADGLAKGPGGALVERIGLGKVAVVGAVVGLIAVLFMARAPLYLIALAISVAWGLTLTSLWPSVMTAVSRYAKPGKESRAMTWAQVAVTPGIVLGAIGTRGLVDVNPAYANALLIGMQLLALLIALSLVRLRIPMNFQQEVRYRWTRLVVLIPAAFAQTLAPGLLGVVIFTYLEMIGRSLISLVPTAVLFGLGMLATLPLAGRLADRRHPRLALLPGLLLLAVVFALVGLPERVVGLLPWLGAVAGVAYGLFVAGWNGMVVRNLPQKHRTAAWGVIMAIEALGYAVGPTFGGLAWDNFGPSGPFWLGAGVLLATQFYYLFNWQAKRARISLHSADTASD